MNPVLIAGGGLAGAAAACLLAQAGREVRLFERQAEPADKICGEFLSREAQLYLNRVGLDPQALGGHVITHLRLVRGGAVATTPLPFRGLGLSRRVLDAALLDHAAASGADVRLGQTLRPDQGQWAGAGAAAVFLATGKHDLPGLRRPVAARAAGLVGFKTYLALDHPQHRALHRHVEVILFPDGYAGLQRIEDGRTNLCLLTGAARLRRVGGTWPALLADLVAESPHLRARLEGAAELLARPLSITRVPYGFLHAPGPDDAPGLFRLGDQMAVIPSFSGDGMSIALHSAAVACQAYLAGRSAAEYHRRMRHELGGQLRRAAVLNRLGYLPAGQRLLMAAARFWPGGLGLAATLTRVPAHRLLPGLG